MENREVLKPHKLSSSSGNPLSFIDSYRWPTMYHKSKAIQVVFAALGQVSSDRLFASTAHPGEDELEIKRGQEALRMIASNPHSPIELLEFLGRHAPDSVQELVAENPSTPADTLRILSLSDSPAVRAAVAENGNTPRSTLWALVYDQSIDVRYRLAENPHIPPRMLGTLAEDENPYVSHRAQRTIKRNSGGQTVYVEFSRVYKANLNGG